MRKPKLNRRSFLKSSSAGLLGTGLLGTGAAVTAHPQTTDEVPHIKGYKTLGRTGFRASDIGCGMTQSETILRAALQAGVNLIETSEMYGRGNDEKKIGRVMKEFKREDLFLVTKITDRTEYPTAEEVIRRAEASMERLQTDYIDCYMIHSAERSGQVRNEVFHEAMDKLISEGRVRFRGVSCHGHSWYSNPDETYEQVLMAAIQDGRFDVILLPYNYIEFETGNRLLEAAKEKNIGTLAMKSNPILLYNVVDGWKKEAESEGDSLSENLTILWQKWKAQTEEAEEFFNKYGYESIEELKDAAVQFILSNPDLHSICSYWPDLMSMEKSIRLSGTSLGSDRQVMLDDFRRLCGPLQCRIGCNQCESACPHNIPVGTIMRYSYYFHAKGRQKYAMQLYHDLPGVRPDVCMTCDGYCQDACPHGVHIQSMVALIHQDLSFNDSYLA